MAPPFGFERGVDLLKGALVVCDVLNHVEHTNDVELLDGRNVARVHLNQRNV